MRIQGTIFFLAAVLPVLLQAEYSAGLDKQSPVKAKIVTDRGSVSAGAPFKAGVLFEIEPGWHIYWKNPGDSGLPTEVELSSPGGLLAESGLEWPVPHLFEGEGGILDYGYEGELLLWKEFSVPAGFDGSTAGLNANVSWVSCREICIPGKAHLSAEVPVTGTAAPSDTDLFSKWESMLPLDPGDGRNPIQMEYRSGLLNSSAARVEVLLTYEDGVSDIRLIPAPAPDIVIENISYKPEESNTGITFDLRSLSGDIRPGTGLDALIVYKRGGAREAVKAPITITE